MTSYNRYTPWLPHLRCSFSDNGSGFFFSNTNKVASFLTTTTTSFEETLQDLSFGNSNPLSSPSPPLMISVISSPAVHVICGFQQSTILIFFIDSSNFFFLFHFFLIG
ncbi:hypothetical protein GYH30_026202 [Glycine max]|nr:hypothetical protein GYH30_026202 [Glycine max]